MTPGYDGLSDQDQQTGQGIIPPKAEQRLRQDAAELADTAKREFDSIAGEAAGQAHEFAEEAKAQLGAATEKVKGIAEQQKEVFAEQLGGVAEAVSKVASELENNDQTTAGYARSIADGVQKFSETMRTSNVDDLMAMAQDLGRKQPAAFIGAAAIAGFAASRFLLASAKRHQSTGTPTPAPAYGTPSQNADAADGEYRTTAAFRDQVGGLN
jgi:hypothetical protein